MCCSRRRCRYTSQRDDGRRKKAEAATETSATRSSKRDLARSLALSLESTNRRANIDGAGYCSQCLFVYFNARDRRELRGWFVYSGGATRGDTRRHTQCTHAAIYIGSDMYIQPSASERARAFPRECLTIAIDGDLALVLSR